MLLVTLYKHTCFGLHSIDQISFGQHSVGRWQVEPLRGKQEALTIKIIKEVMPMIGLIFQMFRIDKRTPEQKKKDKEKEFQRKIRIRNAAFMQWLRDEFRRRQLKEKRQKKRIAAEQAAMKELESSLSKASMALLEFLLLLIDLIIESAIARRQKQLDRIVEKSNKEFSDYQREQALTQKLENVQKIAVKPPAPKPEAKPVEHVQQGEVMSPIERNPELAEWVKNNCGKEVSTGGDDMSPAVKKVWDALNPKAKKLADIRRGESSREEYFQKNLEFYQTMLNKKGNGRGHDYDR